MVVLPQAAKLLVAHIRAHVEGGHSSPRTHVPEFDSLVSRRRDQLSAVGAPADLENTRGGGGVTGNSYFVSSSSCANWRDALAAVRYRNRLLSIFTKQQRPITLKDFKLNETYGIDSSTVGFLSAQRGNFLTRLSIKDDYLEMTPDCVSALHTHVFLQAFS